MGELSIDPYLDAFRQRCDPLADGVIEELSSLPVYRKRNDLYEACLQRAAEADGPCRRFVEETAEIPPWIDEERLARGSAVFLRHGILTMLVGFTVLVESYSGSRDNKVLVMSGRLSHRTAFRRMVETGKFTLDTVDHGGLRPGGAGRRAVLSVRLLHARVRSLCRAMGYDTAKYDQPINQEAMAGTLMLFSAGVVTALEKFGVRLTDQDKQAYHELWRYAGQLMGVAPELLPETYDEELALFERLKAHQYSPDEDTRVLYEHAVIGVSRGASRLRGWIKWLGGGLLAHEPFMRQFSARAVDPILARYLGEATDLKWRAAFGAGRLVVAAASQLESRSRVLRQLNERAQGSFLRRLVAEFAGKRVRYENPGFRRVETQSPQSAAASA